MVTIPQYEARQGLDTSPQTMPNIRVNDAPFEALQGLGNAITKFGNNLTQDQEAARAQQRKLQEFKAQQGWMVVNNNLDSAYATTQANSQTDDGSDVFPTFHDGPFSKEVGDFLKTLPPDLQEEYKYRAEALRSGYEKQATVDGVKKIEKSIDDGINDFTTRVTDDVYSNPDHFEAARRATFDLIDNSGKTSGEKAKLKAEATKKFAEAAVKSLVDSKQYDKARDFLKSRTTIERTNELKKTPPNVKGMMTPNNWQLNFYKPEDLLGRRKDERFIDARTAFAADELGKRFFQATGIRVGVNESHHFDNGPVEGRRRGTSSPINSPHVSKSQHHLGKAIDFQWQSLSPAQKKEFLSMAMDMGFQGVGFYNGGHVHLDMGNARQWGPVPAWAGPILAKRRPKGFGGAITAAVTSSDIAPNYTFASDWSKKIDMAEKQDINLAKKEEVQKQKDTFHDFSLRMWDKDKPLTEDEIKGAYENETINTGQFNTLMRATRAKTKKAEKDTSRPVFKAFLDQAEKVTSREDFDNLNEDMLDAYGNGDINSTDMGLVLKQARKLSGMDDSNKSDPAEKNYRKRLSVMLTPSDSTDKKAQIARLEALLKFDEQVSQLKPEQRNRDVYRKIVDDLAKDAKDLGFDARKDLPMGTYLKGGRYVINQAALYDAATRLKADHDSGKLVGDAFKTELEVLRQWQEALKPKLETK